MENLEKILNEAVPNVDFRSSEVLVDSNTIDSFDIISIIDAVNTAYGIDIDPKDVKPSNFNSYTKIEELIRKYVEQKNG